MRRHLRFIHVPSQPSPIAESTCASASSYYLPQPALTMSSTSSSRAMLILNFGLVYVFWGSTYLAIDIAVEHIPPALMCAVRFLIAGVFMLAFCGFRGRNIWYNPQHLGQMAIVGVL